jgi:hypothetical protein
LPDFFGLSSLLFLSDARLLWFFCPCLGDCLSLSLLLRCTLPLREGGDRDTGLTPGLNDFALSMPLLASGLLFSTRGGVICSIHPSSFWFHTLLGTRSLTAGSRKADIISVLEADNSGSRCLMTCGYSGSRISGSV